MRTLFHITTRDHWERSLAEGRYEADTLASEGFMHSSRPHQVLGVANALFRNQTDLVLLQIAEEKITSKLVYEGRPGRIFPHIYGPLNTDAVVAVFPFAMQGNEYVLPEPLALVGDTLLRPRHSSDDSELAQLRAQSSDFRDPSAPFSQSAQSVVAETANHGIVDFCPLALSYK